MIVTMTHDSAAGSRPLDLLEADRVTLSERVRLPGWLVPVLGVLVGAWVGSPALTGAGDTSTWFSLYVVGVVLIVGATRASGVRLKTVGARGWVAVGLVLAAVLVFYSVSLALESLGLVWWVVVPALLAAVGAVVAVRVIDASRRDVVRRGR